MLGGGPTDDRDGNLLLDELLGAQLHFDPASDYYGIEAAITALADRLRAEGHRPYAIPVGGASAMGCAAYITAVEELRTQLDADPDWMVVADGSGGTHAGLLAGLGDASPTRVLGVDVGTRPDLEAVIPEMALDAAALLGTGPPNRTLLVDHDHVGAGYGELSDECLAAIRLVARTEGLLLDPVYSGKAMAALLSAIRDGRIAAGDERGVLGDRRITRTVRAALRGHAHRPLTRTSGSRRTRSPSCRYVGDDQASPRTLYATAAPSATTISRSKNFFTGNPFPPVGDDRHSIPRPGGGVSTRRGRVRPEVNGVWWPPSSSKRVGRANPVRWVRFLPPPPIRRLRSSSSTRDTLAACHEPP